MNAGPEAAEEVHESAGRLRRLGLGRLAGALVAALLLWFVAMRVPWSDQLLLTATPGADTVTLEGELLSPWRDPSVRFQLALDPDLELTGPLRDLVGGGAIVTAAAGALRPEIGPTLEVEHVEWRAGILRLLGELDAMAFVRGMLIFLGCCVFIVTRWWRLLILAGCPTTWRSVWRVNFVGMFFNVIIPGVSGGDVARAWLIVKGHPERRADAVMSVMVDRVIGLVGMGVLSAVAVNLSDERFSILRVPVTAAAGIMIVACLVFASPWWRKLLRLESWLHKLPQGERLVKLDRAARIYVGHPFEVLLGLLLSIGNHLGACAVAYTFGHAMGDTHAYLDYVCVTTVVNTLSAVPLSPGGLGVGEMLYGSLFVLAGGNYALGVAVSVTYRLCLALLGLAGGLLLLLPGGREVRADYREASAAALE